jgi:hypothetical protein
MALHSPARFDAWLSEIRWGIDKRYILTIGYFGFEPKGSPPAPSTKVQCRSAVDGLTGSSVPPEMQRFLARNKTVGTERVVRSTSFQFHGSRRTAGSAVRKTANPLKLRTKHYLLCVSLATGRRCRPPRRVYNYVRVSLPPFARRPFATGT